VKKRNILILLVAIAALVIAAVPAIAEETTTTPQRAGIERAWPPIWVSKTVDQLKTEVIERSEARIARIESSPLLTDEEKADRIAAVEDLIAAVDTASSRSEVVGLAISRAQLVRQELLADRMGTEPDYETHLAGDVERARTRLARLTRVTGWAEAAGEDVSGIEGLLGQANAQLDSAAGEGNVTNRHDSVHISLAAMTEAAVELDSL
jgi:hypothetical protein